MSFDQFVVRVWRSNSAQQWVTAGAVLVGSYALLRLLRYLMVARLGALARKTSSEVDTLAVDLASRTHEAFLFLVALVAASRTLVLPAPAGRWPGLLLLLVLLFQAALWGNGLINFWARRYLDRRRAETGSASLYTMGALSIAAKVLLWAILIITAIDNLGYSIKAELTTLGIGGIALALAVQNVLGDVLAALAIVLDKPFDVGDPIGVDNLSGTVEHIGLKTTRIRSDTGEQVVIANSELLKSRIRNYKRMYQRQVTFTVEVARDTPPDVVPRIPLVLRDVVTSQNPVRFGRSHFSGYTASALRIETVYYVLDPDYMRYMDIQQAVYLEILRRFAEQGIQFATPAPSIAILPESLSPAGKPLPAAQPR